MRKKRLHIILLSACILLFSGCGGTKQTGQPQKETQDSVSESTDTDDRSAEESVSADVSEPEIAEKPTEPDPLPEVPVDPALYQTEQEIALPDGRILTVTCSCKEFSTGYGISQMDVFTGGTLLQTIPVSDLLSANGDAGISPESGYTNVSDREGSLRLEDLNFDGILDLVLFIDTSDIEKPAYLWFWDDENAKFSYRSRLLNPVADAENRQIICCYPTENASDIADYYQLDETSTPVWARREITTHSDNGKDHTEYYLVQDGELVTDFRVTPLDQIMYAQHDSNVRGGDSTAYEKLGRLRQNDEVKITGQCENGWYQIEYEGQTAYIASNNLGDKPVEKKTPAQQAPASQQPTSQQPASTPQVTAPQPSNSAYYIDDYAWSVLNIVNARRAEAGVGALSMNETLISSAKVRASEISQSFSHNRPDGSSCFTAYNVGYTTAGENIAAGQTSPEEVMNTWMNSEGHKINILEPSFTQIAIACYYIPGDPYEYYWAELFIG